MKIQLLSDLHLEADPALRLAPNPGADLLVLAGDIGSFQRGSRLEGDDFGLERFAPALGWPVPVLYVPGNHEFDGLDHDATLARLQATCDRLGITWLERRSLVLQGVRFIGSTLWADFDAFAEPGPGHLAANLKRREKAFRAANHYLSRHHSLRGGQPMLAQDVRELGLAAQAWLRDALAQPHDGPTVVVTHFAPSLRSADPRYGRTPGTAGFCNALDALLDHADAWLHGHLHCPSDYRHARPAVAGAEPRSCRVVANPLGYASKSEQEGFCPGLLVEIGT